MSLSEPVRWAILAAIALSLSSTRAPAQTKTTFDPTITFGYLRTDDVNLGESGKDSDTVLRLGLELPVNRELRRGSMEFSYRPHIDAYQEFDQLDTVSHELNFSLDLTPTKSSALGLRAGYIDGIEQADAARAEDADLFLAGVTDRQLGRVEIDYGRRLGGQWDWSISGRLAEASFDRIEGFDPGQRGGVEDRTEFGGAFGIARRFSRNVSFGFSYGQREFELDQSGKETTRLLSALGELRQNRGL